MAVLFWPALMERALGRAPDLVDYVLSFVIALFLWTGASAAMHRPGCAPAAVTGGAPAGPPYPHRPRRPPGRRGRTPRPGRRGRQHRDDAERRCTDRDRQRDVAAGDPRGAPPWLTVSQVARTLEDGLSLPADIVGEELIKAITRTPAHEYLLLEQDGTIYGVLATADVDRAFSSRGR